MTTNDSDKHRITTARMAILLLTDVMSGEGMCGGGDDDGGWFDAGDDCGDDGGNEFDEGPDDAVTSDPLPHPLAPRRRHERILGTRQRTNSEQEGPRGADSYKHDVYRNHGSIVGDRGCIGSSRLEQAVENHCIQVYVRVCLLQAYRSTGCSDLTPPRPRPGGRPLPCPWCTGGRGRQRARRRLTTSYSVTHLVRYAPATAPQQPAASGGASGLGDITHITHRPILYTMLFACRIWLHAYTRTSERAWEYYGYVGTAIWNVYGDARILSLLTAGLGKHRRTAVNAFITEAKRVGARRLPGRPPFNVCARVLILHRQGSGHDEAEEDERHHPHLATESRHSSWREDDYTELKSKGSVDVQCEVTVQPIRVWCEHGFAPDALRGGGPVADYRPPPGAGVLAWLYESDASDDERQHHERRAHDGIDERGDEDDRRATPKPRVIRGRNGHTDIIVCNTCQADMVFEDNDWSWCVCGAVRCKNCQQCAWCANGQLGADAPAARPPRLDDPFDFNALRFGDLPVYNGENGNAAIRLHQGEASGNDCAQCGVALGLSGAEWRICRCTARLCVCCARDDCPRCGAGAIGGTVTGLGHDSLPTGLRQHMSTSSSEADSMNDGTDYCSNGDAPTADPVTDMQLLVTPLRLTPSEAAVRRATLKTQRVDTLRARRDGMRNEVRRQTKEGLRPPRGGSRSSTVTYCSCNVTAASTFHEELKYGDVLGGMDGIFVQEHGLTQEQCDNVTGTLRAQGWDTVAGAAYRKNAGHGGGVAVMTSERAGIRPLKLIDGIPGTDIDALNGRFICGVTGDLGGIASASVYGISGQGVSSQLRLWRAVATQMKLIGLPFIIGGDWQVTPQEMQAVGYPELLNAYIVAPSEPTNVISLRTIDFFLVSKSLMPFLKGVEVVKGTRFSPHAPVIVRFEGKRALGTARRLVQPKPLEVHRPCGPMPAGIQVTWNNWKPRGHTTDQHMAGTPRNVSNTDVDEWFAGAEAELLTVFGVAGSPDEARFGGIGAPLVEVKGNVGPTRRETPDALGLLGQRLAWAGRGVHLVVRWAWQMLPPDTGPHEQARDHDQEARPHPHHAHPQPPRDLQLHERRRRTIAKLLASYGHRATAFLRESPIIVDDELGAQVKGTVRRAMQLLASLTRPCHGKAPLLSEWEKGHMDKQIARFVDMEGTIAKAIADLSKARRAKEIKNVRRWANRAPLKVAHAVTKGREVASRHTASACKSHLGEMTAQLAADRGLREWSAQWMAGLDDKSDDIVNIVRRVYEEGPASWAVLDDGTPDEIYLPPITIDRVIKWARRFRGDTGMGSDTLRPRHIALLSRDALAALVLLLTAIEGDQQWPSTLRGVAAVALAKKSGGSRLIGVTGAVYRLWAKIRYDDIREEIEARLARPYMSAAPGIGAERSAVEVALFAEQAHAREEVAATSLVDIAKYFEQITFDELINGAAAVGLPRAVICLALHLYAGPRRVKVGRAWSAPAYPTRSVLPGCTWANVLIRAITVAPAEKLSTALRVKGTDEGCAFKLGIYVDDVHLSTAGRRPVVQRLHPWASRLLVAWVEASLGKRLAPDKKQCVATSSSIRRALQPAMNRLGFAVTEEAELLGTDFAAGGKLRRRSVLRGRISKAVKRRGRLKWWKRMGGNSREIVRGGVVPSVTFGAAACGLPPIALHTMRKLQGAASRISAGGASLTAKLAIGGDDFKDVDPAVLEPAPPLRQLLTILWDQPHARQAFIECWNATSLIFKRCGEPTAWQHIRGPVSAAWAHLKRVEAHWIAPFTLRMLSSDIDVLTTPPKQVYAILRAHARKHFDGMMIVRMMQDAAEEDIDLDAVLARYSEGVDWELLRAVLRNRRRDLTAHEVRALEVVATGAFWPEARRWRAGMRGEGTCEACWTHTGSRRHRLQLCDGVVGHLTWQQIEGRVSREPASADDPAFAPLIIFALPPSYERWRPIRGKYNDGLLVHNAPTTYYGDGSGVGQHSLTRRRATWSLCKLGDQQPEQAAAHYSRGAVGGWFCTSQRGELAALLRFLQFAPRGSTFAGDCNYVLRGICDGVPWPLRSSPSVDADMWKCARRLAQERVGWFDYRKVKAHRSWASVNQLDQQEVEDWYGNTKADVLAKGLAKSMVADIDDPHVQRDRAGCAVLLSRAAMAAAWAMRHWPEGDGGNRRPKGLKKRTEANTTAVGDHIVRPRPRGGLQCIKCKMHAATPSSLRSMRQMRCRGDLSTQCHPTHLLKAFESIVYCRNCGAYATKRPTALKRECRRVPPTEARRNVLRRLRQGLLPTTARYLWELVEEHGAVQATSLGGSRGAGTSGTNGLGTASSRDSCGQPPPTPSYDVNGATEQPCSGHAAVPVPPHHHASLHPSPRHRVDVAHDCRPEVAMQAASMVQEPVAAEMPPASRIGGVARPPVGQAAAIVAQSGSPSTLDAASATSGGCDARPLQRCAAGGGEGAETALEDLRRPWCTMSGKLDGPWTSRVKLLLHAFGGNCNRCGAASKTVCQGCGLGICITCARSRATCARSSSERS